MIPFRTSAASVSLGRRRGTTSASGKILSSRALFLLAALCASIFTMGLLLGTHIIVVKKSTTTKTATTTGADEQQHVVALRGLDKVPDMAKIVQTKHNLKDIIGQSQQQQNQAEEAEKDEFTDAETDDKEEEEGKEEITDAKDDQPNEGEEEQEEEINEEEEDDGNLKEIQKQEKEIEENLPEFKEELEKQEKEMEEQLKQHEEHLKNNMPDILNEEQNEEDHPHLRNPYHDQEERNKRFDIRRPINLNEVNLSNYYLFSTSSSSEKNHIESAIINFGAENNYDGVAFSTWIYLNKLDMNSDANSRTILSTPTLTCKNDGGATSFIGWNLYVNAPNTNNQQLVLQYGTYKHMNNNAYPTCTTLEASGYTIPIEAWTYVSVTSHPTTGIKLYINGEVVAEDKHSDLYRSTSKQSETKSVVGLSATFNALSLEGHMAMIMMFSNVNLVDKDIILLYEAGIDLSLVKATGTLLQHKNTKDKTQNYLYSMYTDGNGSVKTTIMEHFNEINNAIIQFKPTVPPKNDANNNNNIEDANNNNNIEDPDKYKAEEIKFKDEIANYTPLGGGRYADYKNGDNVFSPLNSVKKQEADDLARARRHHIRNAMKHAWEGYRKYAWGNDELHPQSNHGNNNWGGMGTTLVDSLDTLWLMGMKKEFWEARDWVKDHLTCDRTGSVSVFETTIRSLGGLLSAYDWSGDKVFLEKAEDLGQRLFHAVEDSPSGLPYGQTTLNGHRSNNAGWLGGAVLLAEVGTIQVEFRYLSEVIHKKVYAEKVNKVFDVLGNMSSKDGLYPYELNMNQPVSFRNDVLTFGAMADSFYEYLLKCWLQGGKKETKFRKMYDKAMDGMHNQLLFTSRPDGLTYIADKNGHSINHKMDHLACFMAGSLALGAYTHPDGLHSAKAQRDLKTGKALAYTCYQMYARMKTGISPEAVQFNVHGDDLAPVGNAPFYILRPETLESFFILNYLTGDPTYREWGWEVFKSIEKYCRTNTAYGGVKNVNRIAEPENRMESFFLAETIKYAYLLQDPDTEVDILNKHVFNTEAHPTRIFPELKKAGVI